jgi:hypothetical protein
MRAEQMPSKRGDRAAPPPRPGDWDVLLHTSEAAKGWDELCQAAPGNMWDLWVLLRERPTQPLNPARHHRLKGRTLAQRDVKGQVLDQWQYEVTGSGRLWYCPDPERRVVYVTWAGTGHPKMTE